MPGRCLWLEKADILTRHYFFSSVLNIKPPQRLLFILVLVFFGSWRGMSKFVAGLAIINVCY